MEHDSLCEARRARLVIDGEMRDAPPEHWGNCHCAERAFGRDPFPYDMIPIYPWGESDAG